MPPAPSDDGGGTHFRRSSRPGGRVAVRWRRLDDNHDAGAASATSPGFIDAPGEGSGFTANVGVGGAFIETETPLPPGVPLAVELELPPAAHRLELTARVRWVAQRDDEGAGGMGVSFDPLSDEALASLTDYFGTLIDSVDHDELD